MVGQVDHVFKVEFKKAFLGQLAIVSRNHGNQKLHGFGAVAAFSGRNYTGKRLQGIVFVIKSGFAGPTV